MSPDGLEPKLLDFRTVQTRVMPLVATAYALNFTALYMQRLAPQAGLTDGDEDDATGMTDDEKAAALPDLHATCAGLKVGTSSNLDRTHVSMNDVGMNGGGGLVPTTRWH